VNEHTRRNLSGFTSIRSVSMKKRAVKAQTMPPQQAACLRAIRAGKATETHIAVAAGLSLNHTQANLDALRTRGLIERDPLNRTWVLTDKGQAWVADIDRAPAEDTRPSRKMRVGPGGQHLLDLLDRPMRGGELAMHLKVSPQRVRQQVVRLLALGRVRVGDPDRVTLIVARREDPSVLLSYAGERILSSVPQMEETTAAFVATDLGIPVEEVAEQLRFLGKKGLVRETGQSGRGAHYALMEAGAAHPQYRSDAKKARPVPLAVRSNRVCKVLSHLAEHGPARIRELREALSIPHDSANALMQYLKRKGLIRKTSDTLTAPLELTPTGLETQRAMVRRGNQNQG
jgi:DNA-binding MarR family transcriptional regulator